MGKISLWFLGAAAMLLGIYYAAVEAGVPVSSAKLFFVLSVTALTIFLALGGIWASNKFHRMRYPLRISDKAHCAYLATEKELQINFVICDFSGASFFDIECFAHFGKEAINVTRRPAGSLNVTWDPNAECVNGKRMVVERLARDIDLEAPEKCRIEVKMKPHGAFWFWTRKYIDVDTLIIKH